jgi:hypothetical protein
MRILLVTVAVACLLNTGIARAAVEFTPSLTINEEYTDNVYSSHINKQDDFITEIYPGFSLLYEAPIWQWDVKYIYNYRYFANLGESETSSHDLDVKGVINVIDNFFYVDVSDRYERVSTDVTIDRTLEGYFDDQSDKNEFRVSPYFIFNSEGKTPIMVGYAYTNIWYKEDTAIDKEVNTVYLNAIHHLTSRLDLTSDLVFEEQRSNFDTVKQHKVLAGFSYEYAHASKVYAQAGYGWYDTDTDSSGQPFWNAGIIHTTDRYEFTLSTETAYSEDPLANSLLTTTYSIGAKRTGNSNVTSLSFSYEDNIDLDTDETYTKTYGANVSTEQTFTSALKARLSVNYNYYDIIYSDTYTDRYIYTATFEYMMNYGIRAHLTYEYLDMYSPEIEVDNVESTRVILGMTKHF